MKRFFLFGCVAVLVALAPVARGVILGDEDGLLFGDPPDDEDVVPDTPFFAPAQSAGGEPLGASQQPTRPPNEPAPGPDDAPAEAHPEPSLLEQLIAANRFAPDDPRETARQYRMLGDRMVASNRLDEASHAYWQATRTNPVNIGYLHYFGFTLLALGDHQNGHEVYREILARYPDARKALFNLASAHYGLKNYDEALAAMDRYFVVSRREGPKAHFNMGLFLMAAGRTTEAIPWLKKVQPDLPDNPFVPAMLIRLYRMIGDDAEANRLASVNEDRFGAETLQRLLAAEVLPAYLER